MTSNSLKTGATMMVLKQRFLNRGTKSLKKFLNDSTESLKRFLNDDTKNVPQ